MPSVQVQQPHRTVHPNAHKAAHDIQRSFRHKQQLSKQHQQRQRQQQFPSMQRKSSTPKQRSEASLNCLVLKKPRQKTTNAQPRVYGSLLSQAVESEHIMQSRRVMEDLGTAYYAHKQPLWTEVESKLELNPISRTGLLGTTGVKRNGHRTVKPPKTPATSKIQVAEDSLAANHGNARSNNQPRDQPAKGSNRPLATSKMDSMPKKAQAIMIGTDERPVGTDRTKRRAPTEPTKPKLDEFLTPEILDPSTPERYHETLNAVYEDNPLQLLPTSVYRHGPDGRLEVKDFAKPTTVPPSLRYPQPPSLDTSARADSKLSKACKDSRRDTSWENDIPGLLDVPGLIRHSGTSSLPESESSTSYLKNKALPKTPGLSCPGCLIGGKGDLVSNRRKPRERHRGSLHFPEEKDSGFCNACRHRDLLPNMSRFTMIASERSILLDDSEDEGRHKHQTSSRHVADEIHALPNTAASKPHVLDSRFSTGATKDRHLVDRRHLETEAAPSRPRTAPPERQTRNSHIAQCAAAPVPKTSPLGSPNTSYDMQQCASAHMPKTSPLGSPNTSYDMHQFGLLPSHFSVGRRSVSIKLPQPSMTCAEQELSRPLDGNRRSPGCDSIIINTVDEINSALENWEADIFKDYGAMTPVGAAEASVSPLRALLDLSRAVASRKARKKTRRAKLDIPTAKSKIPGDETPRTRMYNRHRRPNGDF